MFMALLVIRMVAYNFLGLSNKRAINFPREESFSSSSLMSVWDSPNMATSAAEIKADPANRNKSTSIFIVKIPLNAVKKIAKQWGSGSKFVSL